MNATDAPTTASSPRGAGPDGKPAPALSVAALLIAFGVLITGNGLQMMLLPIRAQAEGFTAVELGLMGSAYYLGFVLGCLGTPSLIRRAGHVRVFATLAAVTSATALGYPMLIDALPWIALRLIAGFCLAGLYLIVESWINDRATAATRGTLISLYVAVNYTVITLGQMMVTLYDTSSFVLFSLASILFALAAVPLALSQSDEPAQPKIARFRPVRLVRLSPAGTVSIFLIGMIAGAFWSLGPVFAASRSANLTTAALFMSLAVLGAAAAQLPIGRLSDSMDRRHVLIGLSTLSVVACLIVAILPDLGGMWLVFAPLFGATFLPAYAIASAHVFDAAERADYVEVSAGMLLIYGVGSTVGPLIASFGMQFQGPAALLFTMAFIQLVLIAFVARRVARRRSIPADGKQSFDLGATAPVAIMGIIQEETPRD